MYSCKKWSLFAQSGLSIDNKNISRGLTKANILL